MSNIENIIQDTEQNAITEVFWKDFPQKLKETPHCPRKLFVRGKLPDFKNKTLCVVGSRRASQYGKDACHKLITDLRGSNILILSGMALGIDAIAHEAALEAGLPTVAVLGSGLDWNTLYPSSNRKLAKEIVAAGGVLISEMPAHHKPHEYNFPERNRIMAGLADATLVVEATMRSGTLITARLSLDYNRDVCVVPGSIFSKQSEGAHMLLQNGATPITCSQDILTLFGFDTNSVTHHERVLEDCTNLERKIYSLLTESLARADILQNISGEVQEINVALSLLEMKGFIIENEGKLRRR